MSNKVVTGKVRFCFPHLFEPYSIDGESDEKYSVQILVPKKDKKTYQALIDAEQAAAENGKAKWGGKIPSQLASIIHDADEDGTAEDYPERAGHWYLNVSSSKKYPPKVVDQQVQPIMDESEIYSGCYGRVSLTAFAYTFGKKKGISFGLNNVQKMADGEPLDGRTTPDDDFDEVDEEDAALL